jgi:molybdopterin molybdotransferase
MKDEKLMPHRVALEAVLRTVKQIGTENVKLADSAGRVLRTPIKADRPLPPFNRSAVDGYALRIADFHNGKALLDCIGILEAGNIFKKRIKAGEALKIMTGAPVPEGADAVIKVEHSERTGNNVELEERNLNKWLNVHRIGSDAKKGETILDKGVVLNPLHLSVASSVGATNLSVSRLIKTSVISTGTELVPTGKKPKPFQIRDGNSAFLIARILSTGLAEARFEGVIPDDLQKIKNAIRNSLAISDMVIISGGVSVGDSDFTGEAFEQLGVKKIFHRCAMRPGKPVWFGVKGNKTVFGLPGNPVSIAVAFHEFVLPAIKQIAMSYPMPKALFLPLETEIQKRHSLKEFRVALITKTGAVEAVKSYGGSGDFVSSSKSDGIIVIPENSNKIKAGTTVEFHPWDF